MVSLLSTIRLAGGEVDLSHRIQINTTLVGSPAAGAETSVCAITIPQALTTMLGVIIVSTVSFTVGTNGVSTQLRVYHGTSAGTLIGDTNAITATAANLDSRTVIGFDAVPTLPNQTYTVTLTVASGSATSTVSQVRLVAFII